MNLITALIISQFNSLFSTPRIMINPHLPVAEKIQVIAKKQVIVLPAIKLIDIDQSLKEQKVFNSQQ